MCILVLAIAVSRRWPLVVAANRDEAHARASAPLHPWDDAGIVAGRDEVSGGTWLGVSPRGFSAVSNVRGAAPPDPEAPSRGLLVSEWLAGRRDMPPATELDAYNPVNLVAIDRSQALFASNRPVQSRVLAPGLYGFSNGELDEPAAKVGELKAAVAGWLSEDAEEIEPLLAALRSEASVGPGGVPHDGVFVRAAAYGTRCSTIVRVDAEGRGLIHERRFATGGVKTGETVFHFAWGR